MEGTHGDLGVVIDVERAVLVDEGEVLQGGAGGAGDEGEAVRGFRGVGVCAIWDGEGEGEKGEKEGCIVYGIGCFGWFG